MSFYFQHFPKVNYRLFNSRTERVITNPLVRFRLRKVLESRTALYYEYNVEDGERPDVLAKRYYDDETLDWVIFVVNNIIDPYYDWPLSYQNLISFIKTKYGSIVDAKSQIHHYEKIIQPQTKRVDGSIIKERVVRIDENTYNNTLPANRRIVYAYDHEVQLNDEKANIKLLDERYIVGFLREVESIFNDG